MQEINLLQNKLKDKTTQWETRSRVVNILLVFVLIAMIAIGGMFFMLTKSAEDNKVTLDKENVDIQNKLDQMDSQLAKARGFQAQSKNIATLLKTHVVWSELMNEMSSSTLKASRYFSVTSETDGRVHIEGITPTYVDLGKLLLALETSDQFQSVTLLSTAPSKDEAAGVIYAIEVMADPQVFIAEQ